MSTPSLATTSDQKEARNKKAREYRQQKKEASQGVDQSAVTNVTAQVPCLSKQKAIATDVENAATLPAMSTPSPATTSDVKLRSIMGEHNGRGYHEMT
ncbi:hypothetical protein E2562_004445 [Oryza meyeriana var. granulata]|uniref:Uncharacterized protein n=1 Tax=Oryza meyeriana var. granulata TaxID=110450 RepID=A0A6G1CZE8_9ORYZ|nr:hypothetical protein E2562_004445 [Oryza meyeriana var. granulata]